MARTEVKLVGAADIRKALMELESLAARRTVARNALMEAARPLKDAIVANVPVNEGRLRDAIEISAKQPRRRRGQVRTQFRLSIWIKRSKDYRKLQKPRRYTRGRKGAAGTMRDYAYGTVPEVYGAYLEFGRRGQPPRPWMRPAWVSEGGPIALERVGSRVWRELEKAAARQSRRMLKNGRNA